MAAFRGRRCEAPRYNRGMNRRSFLGAAALPALGKPARAAERLPIRKGVLLGMLPERLSLLERFRLAKEVGFELMECPTIRDQQEALAIRDAAAETGLRVHSVMNSDHWKYPLSSANSDDVARSMECMEVSLRNARLWGADTVLLVPAVVNPETRYEEAWERSRNQIRKLIPLAKDLQVVIAVENVWNKFLLSPIEMRDFIDSFGSEHIGSYFDVGNVMLTGYPEQWIRILGKRIRRVHFKDFKTSVGTVEGFCDLLEGSVNWAEVLKALKAVGYDGYCTAEMIPLYAQCPLVRIRNTSTAMDAILAL